MDTIRLRVTQKVIDHGAAGNVGQKQIAMRMPSDGIAPTISSLGHGTRVEIRLGDFFTVIAGDTGAIWGSHNGEHAEDFEALYALLASRPDREMVFVAGLPGSRASPPGPLA